MTSLAKFQARNAELAAILDALSSLDWAVKFAAPYVMSAAISGAERANFQSALRSRSANKTPAFNGMFVIAITNFELFVKDEADEVLGRIAADKKEFSRLDKQFQSTYISSVGRVISGTSSGTVGGVPFTRFEEIVSSFSKSYVGDGALRLAGEVLTLLMGNPTWDRLQKLFSSLGVPEPLGRELASVPALKSYFGNAKWTEVAKNAESFHDGAIRKRNSIVHNVIPTALTDDEVREALKFYDAFATSISVVNSAHI